MIQPNTIAVWPRCWAKENLSRYASRPQASGSCGSCLWWASEQSSRLSGAGGLVNCQRTGCLGAASWERGRLAASLRVPSEPRSILSCALTPTFLCNLPSSVVGSRRKYGSGWAPRVGGALFFVLFSQYVNAHLWNGPPSHPWLWGATTIVLLLFLFSFNDFLRYWLGNFEMPPKAEIQEAPGRMGEK